MEERGEGVCGVCVCVCVCVCVYLLINCNVTLTDDHYVSSFVLILFGIFSELHLCCVL